MPIKRVTGRFPSWDPRGWPEAQLDPPTRPLPRVVGLDDPDPSTPLFNACWRIYGMGGRHALTPDRRPPMGQHHDDDLDGVINRNERRAFSKDDGSVYERIPSDEIDDDGDQIDSTTIVDPGAPD